MFLIPIQSNPGASVAALGALFAAGLIALVGFLYLKKDGKGMN
jgi:hypothetical protein